MSWFVLHLATELELNGKWKAWPHAEGSMVHHSPQSTVHTSLLMINGEFAWGWDEGGKNDNLHLRVESNSSSITITSTTESILRAGNDVDWT